MAKKTGTRLIAENRKARHEFFVLEDYEAGIELFGTEVKSVRDGAAMKKAISSTATRSATGVC